MIARSEDLRAGRLAACYRAIVHVSPPFQPKISEHLVEPDSCFQIGAWRPPPTGLSPTLPSPDPLDFLELISVGLEVREKAYSLGYFIPYPMDFPHTP